VSRHRTKSWSRTRLEAELLRRSELQAHASAHALSVERTSAVHALAVWLEDITRQLDHEEAVVEAADRARQKQRAPQLGTMGVLAPVAGASKTLKSKDPESSGATPSGQSAGTRVDSEPMSEEAKRV